MPFAIIIFGVVFILVGYQGSQSQFFSLLKGDFTGTGNFVYWIVSILIIGSIGYIPRLKNISDGFLMLVIVVLFLSHKGFFSQFTQELSSGTSGTASTPVSTGAGSVSGASTSSLYLPFQPGQTSLTNSQQQQLLNFVNTPP